MSNPRIYMVISTFHPRIGGAERQALEQARCLRERGYAATVVTFRHDRSWQTREVIQGVPVIRVAGRLLQNREKLPRLCQRLLYLLALLTLGWTIWRHRKNYDVLHVHQLSLLALSTALACYLTGKPMIVAVCSAGSGNSAKSRGKPSLLAGPLDGDTTWLQVHGRTWVAGDLEGLERLGKPVVRFTRFLFHRIGATVVVLSSRMQGYLTAHGFTLPNTLLIPNGVDTVRFRTTYANLSDKERAQTVVCVSRLSYEKGIDVLLQAWRLVQEQAPHARLIIVGDGPLQVQLERMAEALGIVDSVEFAGSQSDVPAQLRRANLAVLPSFWEGMPNALLEAMACGLASISTRVSGSEDAIEHGVNGVLVEPQDYQGMALALLSLLGDPALARKYGREARASIEKHYSLDHIVDTYLKLYQTILEGRLAREKQSRSKTHRQYS